MGNGGRFSTNPLYHFKHILRIANFLLSYLGSKQHANRRRQCYRIIGSKFSSVKKPSKLRLGLNLGFKFLDLILLFFSNKINKISTCYKFELSFFNMWISIVVLFFSLWLGMLTRQGGEYSPAPRPHSPTNHPVPDPCCGGFFSPVPIPWIPTVLTGPEIYKRNMTATMTIWWWQFPSFSFLFSLASSRSIRHHGELSRRWRYNRYLLLFTSCIPQNDTHRCRAAMAQSSFFTPILSLCWDELPRWQCLCAALFPFSISAYLHLMLRGGASIATIPATVHHRCAVTAQLPSKT